MKTGSVAVLLMILLVLFLSWAKLGERIAVNYEMLMASSRIVSDATNICPTLRISNENELDDIFKRLEYSEIARLRQILGLYYFAAQDAGAAVRTFASANNNAAADEFWLGCAAYANGDLTQAMVAWRRANASQYFINQGANIGASGNNAAAIRFYTLATQIAPEDANAWLGLAQYQLYLAYAGKVSWQETLNSAERALALGPENLQAHFLVGSALLGGRTDLPRAEQELRLVFARRGGWLEEYVLADVLLARGQVDEATRLLEHALQVRDSSVVRFILVRAYMAGGKCDLQRQSMLDALLVYPDLQRDFRNLCRVNPPCPCDLQLQGP